MSAVDRTVHPPNDIQSLHSGLDIASFLQALTERGHHRCVTIGRCAVKEPDHWHHWLRASGERPRRRAAQSTEKFPSPHVPPLASGQGTARLKLGRWMGLGVTSATARLDPRPMSAFGSFTSISAHPSDVRFTPESDRTADIRKATLSANRCHLHRSKFHRYSITSSARASNVGGTARPIDFAVLRLITSSNVVGCSIGISVGFAPATIF